MNWLRKMIVNRRLRKTMRPDPEFRRRRLAQFSKDRRERYFRNVR